MKSILEKAGLTEEQINNVLEGMNEAKLYTSKEQNIDQRYAKLKAQKTELDNSLKAANDVITGLKEANVNNEALQKQVEDYKLEVDKIKLESATKVKNLTLDNAINVRLGEFDTKYHALLKTAFNRDTLIVSEDGSVTGLDEQYNTIKDTYSDLLVPKVTGKTPANPSGNRGITKEQFNSMSYNERMELYNTNQEAYKTLTQE